MGHYKEISLKGVQRILVCIFKYHGDVLLTYPVYTALKKALPDANIDVYLFKETRSMLEGHPAISAFLEYDQNWRKLSLFGRLRKEFLKWRKVRKNRYDLVINLTSGDRGALVAKVSKAPIRVGIASGKYTDAFFTQLLRETKTPRHIVERNLDAVRALGIFPPLEEREVRFHIPEAAKSGVDEEDFILIHPTSRCDYKHWGTEKFTRLIEALVAKGEKIVLSSGPAAEEIALIEAILSPIRHLPIRNMAGRLSLKSLAAWMEKAKLIVTVDSVPSHIASSLQKPLVVIFGPSDDLKWGPWRNLRAEVVRLAIACKRCDQEGCGGSWHADCLERLPVEKVLRAVERALTAETRCQSMNILLPDCP